MNVIFEKYIEIENLKISPRSIIKCTSCPQYKKNPSCPPNSPEYFLAKEWLQSYSLAMLIKCAIDYSDFEPQKRRMLNYILEKEHKLFNQNKPYVYALFPGSCNLCETCQFEKNGICVFPNKVRYSLDAVGIEIGSIIEINFKESVLYGLILIE